MTPLVIVNGAAGSGKDTVAKMITDAVGGSCIAQADPMKRFAMVVFGFSEDQLWGPSDSRNAEDPRYAPGAEAWDKARIMMDVEGAGEEWLKSIGLGQHINLLMKWFSDLREDFENRQRVLTPRAMLQTLGTEFGRNVSPDIWSKTATHAAGALLKGGYKYDKVFGVVREDGNPGDNIVVITDGRFRNEILNVISLGGAALKLEGPPNNDVEKAGIAGHRSESEQRGIPNFWYDMVYVNDKSRGLEVLNNDVRGIILPQLGIKL